MFARFKDSRPRAVEPENQQTSKANHFLMLGRDPIQHIARATPATKDIVSLASTCRFLHEKIKPVLDQRKLQTLAHYILIEPNEVKVKNLLAHSPEFVDAIIPKIVDSAGRIHKGKTILQLAYGAGDPEMCAMIKSSFIVHYRSEAAGVEAMQKQINEEFGHDTAENQSESENKNAERLALILKPVIAAINAEQFNLGKDDNNKILLSPATLAAIETYRNDLRSWLLSHEKGFHFSYHTLQEAFNTYALLAQQWDYHYNKCVLFEDAVLSSILSYVPKNDAQRFSQGLYYLQQKNEPGRRSLELREGGKNFYDVLQESSAVFALSGSCVDIVDGALRVQGRRERVMPKRGCRGLSKFISNKNINLAELVRPVEPPRQSRPVI